MFDPDLIGSTEGQEQLARQIAEALDADNTDPVPDKDSWIGDKKLRDLESIVVQKQHLYREFGDVCEKASTLSINPEARALLELGQINGLRRLQERECPDDLVQNLFRESEQSIEDLQDSPRKTRLLSLWAYHAGIYASVTGNYGLAALSQERSAALEKAVGNLQGAAISRLRALVEFVNLALVNNPEKVEDELARLRKAANELNEYLADKTDDPTAVRWVYQNCPVHRLSAHFWAGIEYDGSEDYRRLQELAVLDGELYHMQHATIAVAYAIHALNLGNKEEGRRLATDVINDRLGTRPLPLYFATAHLVLARIAVANSQFAEAKLHFQAAAVVQGEAYQVRVVARRELDQI